MPSMFGVQSGRWAEAKIKRSNDDQEIRWREGLKLQQKGRITKVSVHLASSGMTCEDVCDWCVWFGKWLAILRKRCGAQVIMEKANFSRNQIGNRGVYALMTNVFANFVPRQLLLFGNNISDTSSLEQLLASGALYELHLSNNDISADSACRLVVTAAKAKGPDGKYFYPIHGSKPLWMRLESDMCREEFQVKLAENLCRLGRPIWKSVCFVDGTSKCNTFECHCGKEHIPAIHLTYVGSSVLNRKQAANKLLSPKAMPMQKLLNKHHNKPLLVSNFWESNGPVPPPIPPMDLINYPLLGFENKHLITQMSEGPGGVILGYTKNNTNDLPTHVVSGNDDAEYIYCQPDEPGYNFAVDVATRSKGWTSAASIES